MDEAERCGRVGYIYLSRLIANGSPAELKRLPEVSPPGTRRLEVLTQSTSGALAAIKRRPYTISATIFGQSIHLLMDQAVTLRQVEDDLRAEGFAAPQTREISPSLEDVFVTLTDALREDRRD
jgi:ABC-2 type transport system ATP-binding protein